MFEVKKSVYDKSMTSFVVSAIVGLGLKSVVNFNDIFIWILMAVVFVIAYCFSMQIRVRIEFVEKSIIRSQWISKYKISEKKIKKSDILNVSRTIDKISLERRIILKEGKDIKLGKFDKLNGFEDALDAFIFDEKTSKS